jgi:hypothetical protein
MGVHTLELRPSSVDRKFGAGREGRIKREEEDGLRDFLRRPSALHRDLVFKGARLRQVDAGDLDDGLPRGFLAGAIVEVWVALRLNWA